MDYEFDSKENTLVVTDLLADVIIYPDGRVKVMDLDELAVALDKEIINTETMCTCLNRLHNLLSLIDRDKFDRLQERLNKLGL